MMSELASTDETYPSCHATCTTASGTSACNASTGKLLSRLFAFDCEVAGSIVWPCKHQSPTILDARVRVHPTLMKPLISILRQDHPLSWSLSSTYVDCYTLETAEGHLVRLKMMPVSMHTWLTSSCDFDIDMLTRNSTALYAMKHCSYLIPPRKRAMADPLGYISHRVLSGRFSLLKKLYNGDGRLFERMDRAKDLVEAGWIMEDVHGSEAWCVCKHWVLSHPNAIVRMQYGSCRGRVYTTQDTQHTDHLAQCAHGTHGTQWTRGAECVLCHGAIKPNDTVAVLPCGHVFHCCCSDLTDQLGHDAKQLKNRSKGNSTPDSGLLLWLALGNTTCPMCRETIPA